LHLEKSSIFSVILKLFPIIIFVGLFFFVVQMLRQQNTSGDQLNFILTISGIECVVEDICDNQFIILPLAYIFAYFGNIYHGLSLFFEQNFDAPFGSLSVPLLYRRFSSIFGLKSQDQVIFRLNNQVESITGNFPAFWKTMFASFLAEGGLIYLIISIALIFFSFLFFLKIEGNFVSKNILAFKFSIVSFGLMYPPTSEGVLFVCYTYILIYFIYKKLKVKKSQVKVEK
jgi:hypothetical protein